MCETCLESGQPPGKGFSRRATIWIITGLDLAAFCLFSVILVATLGAFSGFLSLIVGHSVLLAAHYAGYDIPLSSSMKAGAVGGTLVTAIVTILLVADKIFFVFVGDFMCRTRYFVPIPVAVAWSAASGAAGVGVMNTSGLLCLDAVHATRAGALGASLAHR